MTIDLIVYPESKLFKHAVHKRNLSFYALTTLIRLLDIKFQFNILHHHIFSFYFVFIKLKRERWHDYNIKENITILFFIMSSVMYLKKYTREKWHSNFIWVITHSPTMCTNNSSKERRQKKKLNLFFILSSFWSLKNKFIISIEIHFYVFEK